MSEPAPRQPHSPDTTGAETAEATGAVLDAAAPPAAGSAAAEPKQRSGAGRVRGFPWRRALGYLLSLVLGLAAYYLATVLNRNVPSYSSLFHTFNQLAGSTLWADIRASLIRVGAGFGIAAVAGTVAGCLMGWYSPLRILFEPWVQFIRMVPTLAFIPLVIVFLGIGETPKILVIALAAFLAITVSVMVGVQNVDRIYVRAARTLGASTGVLFRRVILPATLPYILVGFRLGLANAWTTVVAAELIAASSGLGYLIEQSSSYNETPQIVIAIIFIGLIGLVMDQIMHHLERRFGSWQERAR
jgi:NitT/TauT family transport system permease protein